MNSSDLSFRSFVLHSAIDLLVLVTISFGWVPPSFGDSPPLIIDDNHCLIDVDCSEIFDRSILYSNDDGRFINKLQLIGNYHGQFQTSTLKGSRAGRIGAHYWEHRFFRLGVKVEFLNDFTFHHNWNVGDNTNQNERLAGGDFWGTVHESYLKWNREDSGHDWYILVGKRRQVITREFNAGISDILTIERSMITNDTAQTFAWGAETGFKLNNIEHNFGVWLGGYDMDDFDGRGERMPGFNSRGGASYRGVYPLNDETNLHFDYMFTNTSGGHVPSRGNADANALSNYNQVFALGTESDWNTGEGERSVGLITDLIFGVDRIVTAGNALGIAGGNNSFSPGEDTFGVVILPVRDLTDKLQVVGRYMYASHSRIEQSQTTVFGQSNLARPNLDDVQTFYIGFNYRICGDQLKFVGGYEHMHSKLHETAGSASLGNLTGNSWSIGVRTFW